MITVQQTSNIPTNKTIAATAAGALTTIIVWAVNSYTSHPVPTEIALAMQTVIIAAAGYLTPPSERDHLEPSA